ncbi:MAG: hypothetical protein KHY44_02095 [Clostridiales bacterium]|jgi:hypothetical protein|nr:hypothetical protein [Clostridiales bacterium]
MTKKVKLGMIMLATLVVGSSVYAAKGDAGSSNDPLVTKSYVDSKVTQLQKTVEVQASMIDLLTQEINNMGKEESSSYEVVTVPAGQSIVGKQGTEIIVRSGNGQVLASDGGGLQDMTEGTDLLGGSEIPKYHLVIIPREDGRGIYATKDLIVMVRGGYNIQ